MFELHVSMPGMWSAKYLACEQALHLEISWKVEAIGWNSGYRYGGRIGWSYSKIKRIKFEKGFRQLLEKEVSGYIYSIKQRCIGIFQTKFKS